MELRIDCPLFGNSRVIGDLKFLATNDLVVSFFGLI